jgi:soluble lytic murein transglycosylase
MVGMGLSTLTRVEACVIVAEMKKLVLLLLSLQLMVALACSQAANLLPPPNTEVPAASPSPSAVPATPTLTPTPTPPPTPTPLPANRIGNADQARLEGDWELAGNEYLNALQASSEPEIQSAALLGLARAQIDSGEYQAGVDTLRQLIASYPQSPEFPYAHFSLGQAYSALGLYTESAQAYLDYLINRPGIVDAYVLELRGDALVAAGDYASALIDYRAALQSPGYLNGLDIEIKIARAHAAVGDYETALGIYQSIYDREQSDFTKAQMDYLMGQIYSTLNQPDQAYAYYQDAVNNYPTAYDSYLALIQLVDAGEPVDELNRGIVDYYAAQYGVAMSAFDRYFQAGGIEQSTARYYNGLSLRALGGYDEAVAQWDIIIQNYPEDRFWDDAWDQKAYTQYFFQQEAVRGIQTLLDFVAAAPNHPRAGEFLFDAAEVADINGDLERAAVLWNKVATEYPLYEEAQRASFLAGITRYRLKNYENASALFQRSLSSAVSLQDRAAASFWFGKSQYASGDPIAAQATWELTANIDPTGYYSERARDILRQLAPFAPPQDYDLTFDRQQERSQAEDWLKTTFNLPDDDLSSLGPLLGDERMFRGTELWEIGLKDLARTEFEELRVSLQSDPANSYRLANYMLDLGMYRSAILAARQVLDQAGMSDAETLSAPIYFNHIRFGPYYSDLINPTAEQYGFHPLFLYSVVRQESAFEGFVRSSAGARGLMQIIPATGQEIATGIGWPEEYSDEDLYRPNVSVLYGSEYLAKWRDHFGGDLYAALAAYNGGPGNAIEWHSLSEGDQDLFLEIVRFDETRNYIRGIYEIYNIYRRIYNRTP